MSTIRRLFDHPKNTEIRDGHRGVQVCCNGNAPYWDTYRIYDDKDAWSSRDSERNMPVYRQSDSILVQDDTGLSDNNREVLEVDINGKVIGSNDKRKGYVRVEGPYSGYKPEFISAAEWMAWQGVEFSSDPRGVKMANGQYTTQLPNPPRWRRTRFRDDKVRQCKGPGGWASYGLCLLWCQKCETALERAWSNTLEVLPAVARGIAMVVSYVPVFGTAISFLINTAVTLVEGKPIDQAILDGIGGALPGQPTSGIAFRVGVAIAKGEPFAHAVIDGLPLDRAVKDVLKTAADVVYGIASGENVTDIVYGVIRERMPPDAQRAMDLARRVVNGENIPDMILDEAEQAIVNKVRAAAENITRDARSKGEAAIAEAKREVDSLYNEYATEAGYQIALSRLTTQQRDAISTGLVGGNALSRPKSIGTFGSVPEKNKEVNDTIEERGRKLLAAGITWRGKKLSDLIKAPTFTVTVDQFNALTNTWAPKRMVYKTNDAWRRGFTIAAGLCEGMSKRGPGQTAVYQTLAEAGGRAGFDAGQAVQYERTGGYAGLIPLQQEVSLASPKGISSIAAALGQQVTKKEVPIAFLVTTKPALFTEEAQEQVVAKKLAERDSWVLYYLAMAGRDVPARGMSG